MNNNNSKNKQRFEELRLLSDAWSERWTARTLAPSSGVAAVNSQRAKNMDELNCFPSSGDEKHRCERVKDLRYVQIRFPIITASVCVNMLHLTLKNVPKPPKCR